MTVTLVDGVDDLPDALLIGDAINGLSAFAIECTVPLVGVKSRMFR